MTFNYRPLSDFADVKGGKRLPKGSNLITTPNSHPYIRVRDLGTEKVLELTLDYEYVDDETQATISRYIVNANDVIISIVGTIGLVAIIGKSLDKANLTENCAKIVNIQCLDRDFLYYYLLSEYGQNAIKAATVGAVQAKLPLKNILALPIPDVPLNEQRTIADTLSALDDKIANNSKINHRLEQMAQAIFKSWFVDFEPWGGVMPEDWETTSLSALCSLISRGITPKYVDQGEQIVINQKCIRDHQVVLGSSRFHEPKAPNDKWLKYGDVLVNSTGQGTLGRAAQWLESLTNVTVDSHVSIVRPCTPQYIYYLGLFVTGKEREIEAMAAGSTGQTELSRERLGSLLLLQPKSEQLEEFNKLVEPLMTQIVTNNHESERLASLRDVLLPKLMSGELSIPLIDERRIGDDRTR